MKWPININSQHGSIKRKSDATEPPITSLNGVLRTGRKLSHFTSEKHIANMNIIDTINIGIHMSALRPMFRKLFPAAYTVKKNIGRNTRMDGTVS